MTICIVASLIDSDIVEKLMKKMFTGAGGNGYKSFYIMSTRENPTPKISLN